MSKTRRVDKECHAEFVELIRCIIDQRGITLTDIARIAKVSPSTITRQYPKPTAAHNVSLRTIMKLKRAFPEIECAGNALSRNKQLSESTRLCNGIATCASLALYYLSPIRSSLKKPGPELAEFEFLNGSLEQPAGRVSLPLIVEEERYFIIFMPSDAMLPRFKPGEKLLLDRIRPASPGDDVLLSVRADDGGELFCIARIMEHDRNQVTVQQLGYELTAIIERSKIREVHQIIGVFSAS